MNEHIIPIRLSVNTVKAMSDAELLAALSGEDGRNGMMTMQALQLISAELHARSIERASRPHWTMTPGFWLVVVSAAASIAALFAPYVWPPQDRQRAAQVEAPAPADQSVGPAKKSSP